MARIVAGAASGVREVVLAHQPGSHNQGSAAHLAEAFAGSEDLTGVLNRGNVDALSRSLPFCDKGHLRFPPCGKGTSFVLHHFP